MNVMKEFIIELLNDSHVYKNIHKYKLYDISDKENKLVKKLLNKVLKTKNTEVIYKLESRAKSDYYIIIIPKTVFRSIKYNSMLFVLEVEKLNPKYDNGFKYSLALYNINTNKLLINYNI